MKKDWIARELTVEVVVGVFLAIILLGLFYFTIFLSGKRWNEHRYQFAVQFNDVMGLRENDDVVVRGMPVGSIEQLSLKDKSVLVECSLKKELKMKKDYRITIVSKSLLGGRYLQIFEGSEELPELPSEVQYIGEPPYDLMTDAAELVGAIKDGFTDGGIIDNLKSTTAKIDTIANRLSEGKGTLGKLLLADSSLYDDMAASAASLRAITGRLESGEGTLGRLMSEDDSLYKEVDQIVREVRAVVDDLRETSPVVTFTSVFFGAL